MRKTEGKVDVYGSIAYAPQNPWLAINYTVCLRRYSPNAQDYEWNNQG